MGKPILKLKITNIIFNSIQLEVELLKQDREFYNPNKFSSQIQESYICNRRLKLIAYLTLYSVNSAIFYFFPLWFFMFPFYLFSNFQIWKSAWCKISASVSVYRLWTRKSLTSRVDALKVGIGLFPFFFGISYILYSRYQNQVFSYLLHKNLPVIYPSYPKLTWESFQHIISSELKLDPTHYEIPNKHFSPRLTSQIETLKDRSPGPGSLPHPFEVGLNSVKSKLTDIDEDITQERDFCSNQNTHKNSTNSAFKLTKKAPLPPRGNGATSPLINKYRSQGVGAEARGQKNSGFIEQLDFYSDSFLIRLNSKWTNKKNQGYIGVFPKKSFLEPFSVSPSVKPKFGALPQVNEQSTEATPYNNFSIGATWHLVSPFLTFPLHTNVCEVMLGIPSDGLAETLYQQVVKLDELPKKLNSINSTLNEINEANKVNEADEVNEINEADEVNEINEADEVNEVGDAQRSWASVSESNLNEETPLLPIKKYSKEREKFLTNTLPFPCLLTVSDKKTAAEQRDSTDSFSQAEYKFSQKSKKVIFRSKFVGLSLCSACLPCPVGQRREDKNKYNFINPQITLTSQNTNRIAGSPKLPLVVPGTEKGATLYGFSNQAQFIILDKQANTIKESKSNFLTKLDLLETELKQFFYNTGLKANFLLEEPSLNFSSSESLLNLPKSPISALVADDRATGATVIGKDFNFDKSDSEIFTNSDFIKILEELNNESLLRDFLPSSNMSEDESLEYVEALKELLEIFEDFVSLKTNWATPPRAMSGYDFPDSTNTEARLLISQFFIQNPTSGGWGKGTSKIKNKLDLPCFKVELPPSFTSYSNSNYNYPESKVPTLKIKYKPTFLEGVKKPLYQGPGVTRDDFTQDFNVRNKKQIRRWIKPFLSPDNPLTDRRQAYFARKLMQFDVSAFAPTKDLTPTVALTDTAGEKQDYLDYRDPAPIYTINGEAKGRGKGPAPLISPTNEAPTPSGWEGDNGFSLKKDSDLSAAPLSNMVRIELESIKKTILPMPNKVLKLEKEKLKKVVKRFKRKSMLLGFPVVPFIEESEIPYLSKSKWRVILEKLKAEIAKQLEDKSEEEKAELEKKLEANAPLVFTVYPIQEKLRWPLNKLDYENLNDFVFSSPVTLAVTGRATVKHSNWTTAKHLTFSEQQAKFDFVGNKLRDWHKLPALRRALPLPLPAGFPIGKTLFNNKVVKFRQGGLRSSILFEDIIYEKQKVKPVTERLLCRRDPIEHGRQARLGQENLIKINYHYVPSVQIVFSEYATQKKIFGNVYKRAFTIYQNILENSYESFNSYKRKNYLKLIPTPFITSQGGGAREKTSAFYEALEPITLRSWMMITQLSFFYVVFQIFKELYYKYGKELISYVFDLLVALGLLDPSLKEELGIVDRPAGFRIIRKVSKGFRDIAGIDAILPELGEIVWFLRNSGRSFKLGNILPKGILLVGSPGTGKTLLVQAIAGESGVPVLVQSGSSLNDPEQQEGGEKQLTKLFEKARQMAPCILFIDELDALGESRESVLKNTMGEDEVIEAIQESSESNPASFLSNTIGLGDLMNTGFIPKPKIKFHKTQNNSLDEDQQNALDFSVGEQGSFRDFESYDNSSLTILQQNIDQQEVKHEQLKLLMQFLIEMDGLRTRKGVIVIGATNRPDVLDLALTRPGRFDQILHIALPESQKRIEILKLYSQNLGTETSFASLTWEYLANRTIGFSAADLAAVMNESSMKAILSETVHTIQTIEQGIESITSSRTEDPKHQIPNSTDPFLISRLAYYQAGKAVVHTLLFQHPSVTVLHLWPRQKNARQTYISSIIQNKFLKSSTKLELESRIVGLYAGKAAEFLVLSTSLSSKSAKSSSVVVLPGTATAVPGSNKPWQSDIGIEDLNFATSLVQSMISQWYFYSKDLVVRKSNPIFSQRNLQEIKELYTLELFNHYAIEADTAITQKNRLSNFNRDLQRWSTRPWLQTQITRQIGLRDPVYESWYRIYLPNPEESQWNEEWLRADEFYHNNNNLTDLAVNSVNSLVNCNDLYAIDRDYIYHGLLLSCFNTAFNILDKNRELLDYFAAYLMRNDILRQHEINEILYKFQTESSLSKNTELIAFHKVEKENKQQSLQKNKKIRVIEKAWGPYSKRRVFRFFNFDSILSKL